MLLVSIALGGTVHKRPEWICYRIVWEAASPKSLLERFCWIHAAEELPKRHGNEQGQPSAWRPASVRLGRTSRGWDALDSRLGTLRRRWVQPQRFAAVLGAVD